jgi:hypothetical protein
VELTLVYSKEMEIIHLIILHIFVKLRKLKHGIIRQIGLYNYELGKFVKEDKATVSNRGTGIRFSWVETELKWALKLKSIPRLRI